jgi:hypothetical protein
MSTNPAPADLHRACTARAEQTRQLRARTQQLRALTSATRKDPR